MNNETMTHFGLTQWPFSKEIADAELWLPPSKEPIVDRVCEAIKARHSVLLTGDAGVGKTCVLRAVRHRLATPDIRLTYCHNASLGRRDFYRQLCIALDLNAKATVAALFHAVASHIEELGRDRIHPVILLDESHLLHQDTLDHLHILLNYQWDSRALLSLILVGLPELDDRLKLRRNRALYSRLDCRLHIEPLTPQDTAIYLRTRLEQVGVTHDIFASGAIAILYEASGGTMRDLNRLAALSLTAAARQNCTLIERDLVMNVVANNNQAQATA